MHHKISTWGMSMSLNFLLYWAWYFILFYLASHYKISAKFIIYLLLHREDQEVSYGLKWAIAGKGVIVKDKVFHNLETSELQKGGATYPGMCKLLLSCNDVHLQLIYDTDCIWNMQTVCLVYHFMLEEMSLEVSLVFQKLNLQSFWNWSVLSFGFIPQWDGIQWWLSWM